MKASMIKFLVNFLFFDEDQSNWNKEKGAMSQGLKESLNKGRNLNLLKLDIQQCIHYLQKFTEPL